MTRKEAQLIKDLSINVDDDAENMFFICLYAKGMASKDSIRNIVKSVNRLSGNEKRINRALKTSLKMVDNVKKYGIPCETWCKE